MIRRGIAAVLTWVVQRLCGAFGHDFDLDREPHRIGVVCDKCGWASKGIRLD